MDDLGELEGKDCDPAELVEAHARALADALDRGALPFASLDRCVNSPTVSAVYFTVQVDAPQHPAHDIRLTEPLVAVFANTTDWIRAPEVLALREDFPAEVPHLNLVNWERPKSLCLYEESFRDYRLQWTPARFVERIREWLRRTSRGELHPADQPLEALITAEAAIVVLPHGLQQGEVEFEASIADLPGGRPSDLPLRLEVRTPPHLQGRDIYLAAKAPVAGAPARTTGVPAAAIVARLGPRAHTALRRAPKSFADLHALLANSGEDFRRIVWESLRKWFGHTGPLDVPILLIILVPRQRTAGGPIEKVEAWTFLTTSTLEEFGKKLGAWAASPTGGVGLTLSAVPADGTDIEVTAAITLFTFDRRTAAMVNGRPGPDDRRLAAIGVGALGSQVYLNAVRAAYGQWTLIDNDFLLPHNLGRHGLPPDAVPLPKADALRILGNQLFSDGIRTQSIVADVLAPGSAGPQVNQALGEASAILDMSASVTVARHLSRDLSVPARRVSVFLNPTGTDLTILVEDVDRSVPLDVLEMQLYRLLREEASLHETLTQPTGRVRYGTSCRDVSVPIPQARVGLFAGIATSALQQMLEAPGAQIRHWHQDESTLAVTAYARTPAAEVRVQCGDWTIVTDRDLLRRLGALRAAKLPRETGGVLLGSYDVTRKLVYLVDTIASPPDSEEWPTLYIRGARGLSGEVERISKITAGQVHYIGEWHSHPNRVPPLPSPDDLQVFLWLTEALDADGLPAFMMIVGDQGRIAPFIGRITRDPKELELLKYE